MPIWTKVCLKQFPDVKFDFFEGSGTIKTIENKSREYKFTVNADSDSLLRVNEYYYPGWRAYVNNQETTINYKNMYGIMSLPFKTGNSIIELKLIETPLRAFSNYLSIGSIVLLMIVLMVFLIMV